MPGWTPTAGGALTVAALLIAGCTAGAPDPGPGREAGPELRLVAFDSCAETLKELRAAAGRHVGPYGFAAGGWRDLAGGAERATGAVPDAKAAAPGASNGAPARGQADHSTTNTHEAGVDEADLVKTDGRRIVTIVDGTLRVADVASWRLTGRLDIGGTPTAPTGLTATGLLLQGDRALVIAFPNGPRPAGTAPGEPVPGMPMWATGSQLVLVDLTGAPKVVSRLAMEGEYVDARQVGSIARVVVRSSPRLRFGYPDGIRSPEQTAQQNRAVVARSMLDDWLPHYQLERDGAKVPGRVGCEQVVRPSEFTGTSMLTVYTLDLRAALDAGDPLTVMADGDTVYASERTLYVAHDAFTRGIPVAGKPVRPDDARLAQPRTEIYAFDIAGEKRPRFSASGRVPGALLNQYALSEHAGHLRVATTSALAGAEQATATESAVYVLASRGGRLAEVGRVGGLGKGERIYAVRFAGPVGYVVTFRQVDPLYTLDLRDPARPRVVGELKITGYSAYLHPVDDKNLIGVGQEASEEGRRLGTQVSVFDVGDPARPRRIAQYHLPDGGSEVEFDPHAFLYWPKTGQLVIPVNASHTVSTPEIPGAGRTETGVSPVLASGALVLSLRDGRLVEQGMIRHPVDAARAYDATIRRSLITGDTLWTISAAGLRADGVASLTQQAWLPFH